MAALAAGGAGLRPAPRERAAADAPTAPRPLADRVTRAAIFALFPYPRRLRVAIAPLRLAQRTGADRLLARSGLVGRVSPAAEQALRLAPPSRPLPPGRFPERVPARGARRAVVGMLTGCVQSVFYPGVNAATARVLAAEGCDVIIPRDQGCCGALSLHSGRAAEAIRFAKQTIATFETAGVDVIVVNSAGCGSAMKEYERLFARLAADGGGGGGRRPGPRPRCRGRWRRLPGRPGRRCCRRGSATSLSSWTSLDRSRCEARFRCGRPTTTRAISGTRSGSPPRRAPCCARSPSSTWPNCATPGSAAGRRASTTCCSRTAASALGTTEGRLGHRLRRVPPHLRQPRLHAADLGRAGGPGGDDADRAHRRDPRRLDQRRAARLIGACQTESAHYRSKFHAIPACYGYRIPLPISFCALNPATYQFLRHISDKRGGKAVRTDRKLRSLVRTDTKAGGRRHRYRV